MNLKYTPILFIFYLLACSNSTKDKKEILHNNNFKDKIIHDTIIKEYDKDGQHYFEKLVNDSMLVRKIFAEGKLIYNMPINPLNFPKSKIYLSSGLNYLTNSKTDIINIINPEMPLMYRAINVEGGVISWHSDTSYTIRVSPKNKTKETIKLFITVLKDSSDYQYHNFISDSVLIPIK